MTERKNLIYFYFSCNGAFNRLRFLISFVTLTAFLSIVVSQKIVIFTLLGNLLVFYALLMAVQKRSRDMNKQGTVFILLFSAIFPILRACGYLLEDGVYADNVYVIRLAVISVISYILLLMPLFLIPSAKENNPVIKSPLLKNPLLYFLICVAIFALAFYLFHIYLL